MGVAAQAGRGSSGLARVAVARLLVVVLVSLATLAATQTSSVYGRSS